MPAQLRCNAARTFKLVSKSSPNSSAESPPMTLQTVGMCGRLALPVTAWLLTRRPKQTAMLEAQYQ